MNAHPGAPAGAGDSAGLPWAGREVTGSAYADDDGSADPALHAALAGDDEVAWMAALTRARLLVPIVAVATQPDDDGEGQDVQVSGDKGADMAVVTLTSPDGERALPAFTSVAALAAWNPAARPTPVPAAQAAQAAVAERCDVMVLDLGGGSRVLRPSMVWALAQGRPWTPAYADPFVQQSVSRAAAADDRIGAVRCEAGAPGELRVVLVLAPGHSRDEVAQIAAGLGERIATDGEARARIDALAFSVQAG